MGFAYRGGRWVVTQALFVLAVDHICYAFAREGGQLVDWSWLPRSAAGLRACPFWAGAWRYLPDHPPALGWSKSL